LETLRWTWLAALLAAGLGTSCATTKTAETPSGTDTPVAGAPNSAPDGGIYGPTPVASPAPAENYGPTARQIRPIVLVLGPGMARGFAHAGVLKALHDERIPIGAIVGTEMGALMGTLYAMSDTVNRFEWALLKFKDETFEETAGLLARLRRQPSDGKKLADALKSTLSNRNLADSRIPVRVGVQMLGAGSSELFSTGSAYAAVRASMAVAGLMTPGSVIQPEDAGSTVTSRPYPVSEAKALGIGPVVVVDLLEDDPTGGEGDEDKAKLAASRLQSARRLGSEEIKAADLVIAPSMRGIGALDYKMRTESMFRGKKAAKEKLAELKRITGLSTAGGAQ
jgi:NTE family protein